jgi:hypothetical protein
MTAFAKSPHQALRVLLSLREGNEVRGSLSFSSLPPFSYVAIS